MTRETMLHLNTQTLIGQTDKRGYAWSYRASLQGAESNHYPGAIPVADVQRRLFDWEPLSVPVSITVPATLEDMTTMNAEGNPLKVLTVPDRQAIVHPRTLETFGVFKDGYTVHSYSQWLLAEVSNILGDTLAISSAGLLRGGAVAWVEVSVPETIATPEGVTFRPNLLAVTSLDGSLATRFKRTFNNTVCDNTMYGALGELGQEIKIKHSRYSKVKLDEARTSLNLVHEGAAAFEAEIARLARVTVTDRTWSAFLDEYTPVPEGKGAKVTNAEKKRAELTRLWNHDARVTPWKNTGWGVMQAVNTYAHHSVNVRGDRAERNMAKTIEGDFARLDSNTNFALNRVLVAAR